MPRQKKAEVVKATIIEPTKSANAAKVSRSESFWGGKPKESYQASSELAKETQSLNLSFVPGISSSNYRMNSGITTVGQVMPPMVKNMMSSIFGSVGLQFSVDDICLSKDNTDSIKKIIEVTDMITQQADLLPALKKAIKAGLKGAKTYSDFQRDVALATLKAQTGIDQNSADVLLAMGGYAVRKNKIEMELELGLRQLEQLDKDTRDKITERWGKYYNLTNTRKQISLRVAQSLERKQIASAEANGQKKINRNSKTSEVETHGKE